MEDPKKLNNFIEKPAEQDPAFYNVMPKSEIHGQIIDPKIKISESATNVVEKDNLLANFFIKHKRLLIIVIIILALAYPAYYLFNKFAFPNFSEEILINEEALKNAAEKKSNASASTTPEELPYKTPADWQQRFFGNEKCQDLNQCGDNADPDRDGLKNLEEYQKGTDPNNPDSDQDGLSDGDEALIFGSDPTNARTANDLNYNDGQYIKGGYNPKSINQILNAEQIKEITFNLRQYGLHQPSITTIGESLLKIYQFTPDITEPTNASSTPATSTQDSLEQSPEKKLDRDTQRSNTIKNIGMALTKFFQDKKKFPETSTFSVMYDAVKPYIKVATNPTDPINKDRYVYTYSASSDLQDFTLTFFSETHNQIIRTDSKTAQKYLTDEQAAINDDQRKTNLDTLRTALLLYSGNHSAGNQDYAFPKTTEYKNALTTENFISEIPKDPKTGQDYEYQVSSTFDSFTLKAMLEAPAPGRTGYLCNQEECREY